MHKTEWTVFGGGKTMTYGSFFIRACLVAALAAWSWGCSTTRSHQAKNVILFLADGTGIPTLHAASLYGYGEPQRLFVQQMPYLGFAETAPADGWVTDSAAAMTAIMTGEKTDVGVVSQSADAVRGQKDGRLLKTLLEYAEERGLATGVISNSPVSDATPAACYAHANERAKHGFIFAQILTPRFGDGVDVVIGPGRQLILDQTKELGLDLAAGLHQQGYTFVDQPSAMEKAAPKTHRLIALFPSEEFDLSLCVDKALDILTRNPKGFFLMVESNNHFPDVKLTLSRMVAMDRIVRRTVERMEGTDTLVLFTADHSYDLSITASPRTQKILPHVNVNNLHTAEEVLVAAQGPGADQVRGMFPNTRLFHIMKDAYGW